MLPEAVLVSAAMNISIPRTVVLGAVLLIPLRFLTPQAGVPVQRVPQFENDEVSVWKTTVTPNAPLSMHTHQHPRIVVALRGGTMKIVRESGGSETEKWETGKAYWLSSEEGKARHADQNVGSDPIEVMVVELKKAQ